MADLKCIEISECYSCEKTLGSICVRELQILVVFLSVFLYFKGRMVFGCFKGFCVCMSCLLVLCVLAFVSRCARVFILVTATHRLKLA